MSDRYEQLEPIATGDFAIVFRGRDTELGRDVAIKQIHQQFRDDPAQLERYWKEAQLLATLEHPCIMNLYDVVKDRGWLILELMQGSLKEKLAGEPIDLEDLRLTLTYVLHALQFLHENGIVHGDVKPGNLLLDKKSTVKLGDFGIARRISGDDGSVIKGTTKYMAPEVLSDQFGEVGPHSDLYSLGFTAYELMCGEQFESLFPGLSMFGRDPQMAWMMWHSTTDRHIPEIDQVLQGVPPDLATVVQKLCRKDPAKRYKSAADALADLKAGAVSAPPPPPGEKKEGAAKTDGDEEAAVEKSGSSKRLYLVIGALAVSVLLSIGILFIPTGGAPAGGTDDDGAVASQLPKAGVIKRIETGKAVMYVDVEGKENAVPIQIGENDRVFLNKSESAFDQLAVGDEIEIDELEKDGKPFKEIKASRPETSTAEGQVSAAPDIDKLLLTVAAADGPVTVHLPTGVKISLNGLTTTAGRPIYLSDLAKGDFVTVTHYLDKDQNVAKSISATRLIERTGKVASVSAAKQTITIIDEKTGGQVTVPLAAGCKLTINGADSSNDRPLKLTDLRTDDLVTMTHDAAVRTLAVVRGLSVQGSVVSIANDPARVTVSHDGEETLFTIGSETEISLASTGEAIKLNFLRPGDMVEVFHETLDGASQAGTIAVTPKPDPKRWAIVVSRKAFDEANKGHTVADAVMVRDALLRNYRVGPTQLKYIENANPATLAAEIADFASRTPADGELIVYLAADSSLDAGIPVIAGGAPLINFVQAVERSPAKGTVLLLDTARTESQPSAAELAAASKGTRRFVSDSVTVIAACSGDQYGAEAIAKEEETPHGLFAEYVSAALRLEADVRPRDGKVEIGELFAFLDAKFKAVLGTAGIVQTPQLLTPGIEPRLAPATVAAVRKILSSVRFDDELHLTYGAARGSAPDSPDVNAAYALALHKAGETKEAYDLVNAVRRAHPDYAPAMPLSAWLHLAAGEIVERDTKKRALTHARAIVELQALIDSLPSPPSGGDADASLGEQAVVDFAAMAGELRVFATSAADPAVDAALVAVLDQAAKNRGGAIYDAYLKGGRGIFAEIKKHDEKITAASNDAAKGLLKNARQRVTTFADFPHAAAAEWIRMELLK